jgi:D-ribulokinase
MDKSLDGLVGLYLAGLCGLGYGARQIVSAMRQHGTEIDTIVVSGGAAQDPLVRQLLADTTGTVVAATTAPEPVLLGAAILGAVASGRHDDIAVAMREMSEIGNIYRPSAMLSEWHRGRSAAFAILQEAGRAIRRPL